ncbi:MAG: hypothetical protein WC004_04380 [Candidatus Absconditabacterales bacterium]
MNITPISDSMSCHGTENNVQVTLQFLGNKEQYDCWRMQQATADCLRRAQLKTDSVQGQRTWTSACGNYSAIIIYDLQ